ncbi:MAG: tetratricopeptide repeat protein [Cytophagales bacterium]
MMKHYRRLYIFISFIVSFTIFAQQTLINTTEDACFRNALEMFNNKQYAQAEQLFDQYVSHDKVNANDIKYVDAQYYSAICDLYLYHDNAELKIAEFVKKYPRYPKSTKANFDLANYFYNTKNYPKAIAAYEKVDVSNLDAIEALDYKFRLAYAYMIEKNYSKATLFNEVKVQNSNFKETAIYYAAFVNHKNDFLNEAQSDCEYLLENENFKTIVPALYMSVLCKQKKYTEVIDYVTKLDTAKVAYKQADDVHLLAGEANYHLKKYSEAVSHYEKVSFIAKAQPDTAFKYGYSLYENNQFEKAATVFKSMDALKNLVGQYASFYLGMCYLNVGNKQFALSAFTEAADLKYDIHHKIKPKALFYQGQVNFDLHNFNDAVICFKRFNELYPKNDLTDEANGLLSESFLNSNNYQEAIKYIEKLPKKTERTQSAYQKVTFYKAMELYNDNKVDLALEFLDKSLENPKNVSFTQKAFYWKGEGLSVLKMYDDAREAYKSIPEGDMYYTTKSYYGLGYTYYFQKKYPEAQKAFILYRDNHKKDNNFKNYVDVIIRIADCDYITKKYDEALAGYESALAANPTSDVDYILFQKASVLEIQENYEEARKNYELLIRRYPSSVYYDNALFQKANIEFVRNNFDATASITSTLIKDRPDSKLLPLALMMRAKSYKNSDKVELSIVDLKKILSDFPHSAVVKEAIQELQESYSRIDKDEEFEKVMEDFNTSNPEHTDIEQLQYQTAVNAYSAKKWDMAIIKMKSFIEKYPNSTYIPNFESNIASAYWAKNDSNNAAIYFSKVIDRNQSDFVLESVSNLAKIELNRNHLKEANKLYIRLMNMSTNQNEILQAQYGLMENYYKAQKYDSSKYYSSVILKSGTKNVNLVNKTNLLLGYSLLNLKDTTGAIAQFMQMLNSTQDEYGAEANYRAAELFYKTKQYKQSIDKIYFLREKYKNYKNWYYNSFILLVDNYLAMNEIYQAKAILKSIIDKSKDKEFVEKAKSKMQYIQQNYKNTSEDENAE